MNIQNINSRNRQINSAKHTQSPDNKFENVLKSNIKNESYDDKSITRSNPLSNAEQIESVRHLRISNMRQISINGLKELVKDAASDTGTQILHEIEMLCDDDTVENIDMKLLDELLELYKETR